MHGARKQKIPSQVVNMSSNPNHYLQVKTLLALGNYFDARKLAVLPNDIIEAAVEGA